MPGQKGGLSLRIDADRLCEPVWTMDMESPYLPYEYAPPSPQTPGLPAGGRRRVAWWCSGVLWCVLLRVLLRAAARRCRHAMPCHAMPVLHGHASVSHLQAMEPPQASNSPSKRPIKPLDSTPGLPAARSTIHASTLAPPNRSQQPAASGRPSARPRPRQAPQHAVSARHPPRRRPAVR